MRTPKHCTIQKSSVFRIIDKPCHVHASTFIIAITSKLHVAIPCFCRNAIDKAPKLIEKKGICLKNSRYNFQIAVNGKARKYFCKIKVEGTPAEFVTVREVQNVPVHFPFPEYNEDPFVLSKKVGLYPDLLAPLTSVGYPIFVNQ